MATTYTSTITIQCWKEHTCAGCGAVYAYPFTRKVTGSSGNAEKARVNAQAKVATTLAREVDQHACPSCGLYQLDMIGQQRAKRHWLVFWLALVALAVLIIMRAAYGIQSNLATWALVVVAGIAAFAFLGIDLNNPNTNPEGNRQRSTDKVTAGTIRHTPSQQSAMATPPDEIARPRRSMMHQGALALIVGAVALVASPELLRSSQHWPLNEEAYPPVVGAGDTTRIYMGQKISSIKGYWNGRPTVLLHDPAAPASTTPITAAAKTNETTWGSTISAKSSEKNNSSSPWVEVTVPAMPDLSGKTITCDIDLNVEYPEMSGSSNFVRKHMDMKRTVPLAMAVAGAGTRYTSWWWQATLLGAAAILIGGVILIRSARALQRRANPTRTYT
jgi:hypothetical protein